MVLHASHNLDVRTHKFFESDWISLEVEMGKDGAAFVGELDEKPWPALVVEMPDLLDFNPGEVVKATQHVAGGCIGVIINLESLSEISEQDLFDIFPLFRDLV